MNQEAAVQPTMWCSQCGRSLAPSDVVQIAGIDAVGLGSETGGSV